MQHTKTMRSQYMQALATVKETDSAQYWKKYSNTLTDASFYSLDY